MESFAEQVGSDLLHCGEQAGECVLSNVSGIATAAERGFASNVDHGLAAGVAGGLEGAIGTGLEDMGSGLIQNEN